MLWNPETRYFLSLAAARQAPALEWSLALSRKSGAAPAGLLAALFAGSAAFAWLILPSPHTPFHGMLAGAFATGITMLALLTLLSLRRKP